MGIDNKAAGAGYDGKEKSFLYIVKTERGVIGPVFAIKEKALQLAKSHVKDMKQVSKGYSTWAQVLKVSCDIEDLFM